MSDSSTEKITPKILPLGDAAWTIEFGSRVDPVLHARVLGLASAVEKKRLTTEGGKEDGGNGRSPGFGAIVDVVPTFRSLTVHFDPLRCNGGDLGEALLQLARTSGAISAKGRNWCIPVCFDEDYAPDLGDLAQNKGMTREAVVKLMTQTEFQVYMIGFMPGFPYMGGLPAQLQMPRLTNPRKAVPERSLAVAADMCAVYPWESPGGWRLLGRTPVPMFSMATPDTPSLLASGDRVHWRAIDSATYLEMEAVTKAGRLDRDSLLSSPEGEKS